MKKVSVLIILLTAVLFVTFAVNADEVTQTPSAPEITEEPQADPSADPQNGPSDEMPEITETPEEGAGQTEDGAGDDSAGQGEDTDQTDQQSDQPLTEPEFTMPEEETEEGGNPEAEETSEDSETENEDPKENEASDFESEEEKTWQQELDENRAENKSMINSATPVANSVWIDTVAHPCNGHLLSSAKYGRFHGLTDFTFFTAQESGSYSAYIAGNGMVVLGKYQCTDFGAQGNGTAGALIAYMAANCGGDAADLYSALYQAYVVEQRTAVDEWNACALYDTENFMAMQDQFAYEHYYLRGEAAVEAAGISLSERPWVVKGMCFSLFDALGPYNEYGSGAYAITTAGILPDDSNAVFIEKICANMAALYAEKYPWMYGRYVDGSDTALGISDKDLALEILSGSLFAEEEPISDVITEVEIQDTTPQSAKEKGVTVRTIRVSAKRIREYTLESETRVLKSPKDFVVSKETNEEGKMKNYTISGEGLYEGQTMEKTVALSE